MTRTELFHNWVFEFEQMDSTWKQTRYLISLLPEAIRLRNKSVADIHDHEKPVHALDKLLMELEIKTNLSDDYLISSYVARLLKMEDKEKLIQLLESQQVPTLN
jgi:hypothetical protein